MLSNKDKKNEVQKIGVIGAGSWGTSLANLLAEKGYTVYLWAYEPEVRQDILKYGENRLFLPNIKLSNNIIPTNDLDEVVKYNKILLIVVPSHTMRQIANQISQSILRDSIVITKEWE
jgi:glycerol-3-phosphate dehydrogenase (NAD(P)+)